MKWKLHACRFKLLLKELKNQLYIWIPFKKSYKNLAFDYKDEIYQDWLLLLNFKIFIYIHILPKLLLNMLVAYITNAIVFYK